MVFCRVRQCQTESRDGKVSSSVVVAPDHLPRRSSYISLCSVPVVLLVLLLAYALAIGSPKRPFYNQARTNMPLPGLTPRPVSTHSMAQPVDSAASTRPTSLDKKEAEAIIGIAETDSTQDSDEQLLAQIGYKQVRYTTSPCPLTNLLKNGILGKS